MQSPGTRDSFSCWKVSKSARTTPARASPSWKGQQESPKRQLWDLLDNAVPVLSSDLSSTNPTLFGSTKLWLLSSPWEQKSCKEPSSKEREEVWFVADPSLISARAPFPGSGGILRFFRTHPAAGCPCSLWPCASSFPEPSFGIPSCWPPLPLPPPPQCFPAPHF